jgi:hexokinase
MSAISSLIHDELLSSTLQKGFYALAVCSVIGTAAYLGYKAAGSEDKHILHSRHPESNEQIEKVLESLRLDDDILRQIMQLLDQEMEAGLSPATHKTADVKMFPTYVRNIANGSETGQVLALDLGGTNFRVLLVSLLPQSKVELTSKIFVIPQSIMLGEGVNVKRRFAKENKD